MGTDGAEADDRAMTENTPSEERGDERADQGDHLPDEPASPATPTATSGTPADDTVADATATTTATATTLLADEPAAGEHNWDEPRWDEPRWDEPQWDEPDLAPAGPRRLYRSRSDRMLGGVAGGIADYFGIDPVLVRLAFVALTLLGGAGPIGYVIAWIVVPEEPEDGVDAGGGRSRRRGRDHERAPEGHRDARQIAGFVLLAFGAMALLHRFGLGIRGDVVGPLALIGIGAAVLWSRRNAPPSPPSPGAPGGGSPSASRPGSAAPTRSATSAGRARADRVDRGTRRSVAVAPPAPPSPELLAWRARRARGRRLAGATLGILFIGAGIVALLANAGTIDVDLQAVLAGALVTVGLALIIGAWVGRPRGFVALGVLLTLAVAATSTLDVSWHGGIGERVHRPVAASEVRSAYNLGIGNLEVDLSQVDLSGRRAEVTAEVGIGKLSVSVPDGVRVVVDSHVGMGRSVLFGEEKDGTSVDETADDPGTTASAGILYLHTRVGMGDLEVARNGRFGVLDRGELR